MKRLAYVVAIVVLPWCITGCNKTPPAPSLVPVKGTVTLDGKAMEGGQILFTVAGQPPRSIEIKNGEFSGEANVGKNQVQVIWNQDGPPNPMDPSSRIQVNVVGPNFWGPNSTLSADVGASGATDLKFAVTSVKK